MKTNPFRSYFLYDKQQRRGLLVLFSLIAVLQGILFFADFSHPETQTAARQQWLSLKPVADTLGFKPYRKTIYPFNPNYINDFKGYKLGMSLVQLRRLHQWRKQGKYVNSAGEFQQVTQVSDSLLAAIAPYFKFPDWVKNRQPNQKSNWVDFSKLSREKKSKAPKIDINRATKEELMKVYGIGEGISDRILKLKERFGAFVSMEQMQDVWGLSPEVIEKLNDGFAVIENPNPKKIDINNATIKELGQFPYFRYPISKNIVTYRSMQGDIKPEDLENIKDFPLDKIKIIALYLDF